MAHIKPLPSGRYFVRIKKKGYPDQSKTFLNKKDAQRWAKSVESDMDKGVFVDRSSAEGTTLSEVLDRYLLEVTPLKRSRDEKRLIGQWKKHPLARRSLASLNPMDFVQYRDDRLKQVATQTVRHELGLISNLFNVCRKEWQIAVLNPIDSIRKPPQGKARNRRLEDGEYTRLTQAARTSKNPLLAPLIIIAVETGMRLGELLGLTWKDVDLTKRTAQLWETKNGDSRTVPLSLLAVDTIRQIPRHIKEERVFYTWAQRPDSISSSWRSVCRKAEITDLHFHDLRHEAVTRLFELGLNQFEVANISGHKTMQMLARYTHLEANHIISKLDRRG